MMTSNFASGKELFNTKSRNHVLPSWGVKQSEVVLGSWLQEKQVEDRLQDCQELISEIRLTRKDQLAQGRWIEESKMVQLIQQTGSFWEHMGVETDIGRCLYPEEAIYLIETGELEVLHRGMPLSVQSAHTVMILNHYHLDQYHVYADLARSGCKVVRHQPYLRFTKYEKQIRLDQHQAKKKKSKLKLKGDNTSLKSIKSQASSEVQGSGTDVEIIEDKTSLDDAIMDFYNVIGEDIPSELKTNKSQPEIIEIFDSTDSDTEKDEISVLPGPKKGLDSYDTKKQQLLNMFPSMLGTECQMVQAEDVKLCPKNSKPQKKDYLVSLKILNYYSKYFDDAQQNCDQNSGWNNNWNRGRRNFRTGQRNNDNSFHGNYKKGNWREEKGNGGYFNQGLDAGDAIPYQHCPQNNSSNFNSFDVRNQEYSNDTRSNMNYTDHIPKRTHNEWSRSSLTSQWEDGRNHSRFDPVADRRFEIGSGEEDWSVIQERSTGGGDLYVRGVVQKRSIANSPDDMGLSQKIPKLASDDWRKGNRRLHSDEYDGNEKSRSQGMSEFLESTASWRSEDVQKIGRHTEESNFRGNYRKPDWHQHDDRCESEERLSENRMRSMGRWPGCDMASYSQETTAGMIDGPNNRYESRMGLKGYGEDRDDKSSTSRDDKRIPSGSRSEGGLRDSRTDRMGHENESHPAYSLRPSWHQHDDRSLALNNQEDNRLSVQELEKTLVDLSAAPHWKTKKRKRRRDQFCDYPSYLMKIALNVNSWKEYKAIVNSITEDKSLSGKVLWRGPTLPLVKPTMATTVGSILNKCKILGVESDMQQDGHKITKESLLPLHFDVYLPKRTFKKSNPSIPGKRITVIRDGEVPSLTQIQEVTGRFQDEAPVVCAVVSSGEVRLYTLTPITIPSPNRT